MMCPCWARFDGGGEEVCVRGKFCWNGGAKVCFVATLLTACGAQDGLSRATDAEDDQRRAAKFTVPVADADALHLHYTQGKQRLDMRVLRAAASEAENIAPCVRLEDATGFAVISSGVAEACPQNFLASQGHGRGAVTRDDAVHFLERNVALEQMLAAARKARPSGADEQLWRHALAHLELFVTPADVAVRPAALSEVSAPRNLSSAVKQVPSAAARLTQSIALSAAGAQQTEAATPAVHAFFGPIGDWAAGGFTPRERVQIEDLEFRQEVGLYAKKVRKYLFFGEVGDMDHTGAHLVVFARPRGSQDAWQKFAETWTQNHGTPPTHPSMELYETCVDLPVTTGWFAWKGECPGKWGDDHLCNDDTRYQLWHAHGQWDDEVACANTYQAMRPTCRKPW